MEFYIAIGRHRRLSDGLMRHLDGSIGRATRLSRTQVLIVTMGMIAATGLADRLASPDIWFGPVYLLAILLPAWALGWRSGIVAALGCATVSISANGLHLYPLGGLALAWNMAMRLLVVVTIVGLMGGCRRSYDHEWRQARRDGLTGLLNKQAFYEEAATPRRRQAWAILCYVDLDGFKQINDQHGHAAGDEVLQLFAEGVRRQLRADDVVARIGGDEFLLLLPVRDEADGQRLAGQLHARLNAILDRSLYPARCSMGVVIMPPRSDTLGAADVRLADRLMYEAKKDGAGLRTATHGSLTAEAAAADVDCPPAPGARPATETAH